MVPYVEILLPFRCYFDGDEYWLLSWGGGGNVLGHAKQADVYARRRNHVAQELPIAVITKSLVTIDVAFAGGAARCSGIMERWMYFSPSVGKATLHQQLPIAVV
jgi:hypothetical protein